ncbi:MAG: LptF/LptG family permease [Sulfurimonas sp.]
MKMLTPPLYFSYLVKHYLKNLLVILLGLSLAISVIDFLQQMQKLESLGGYQLYYIFYRWEESLTTLYPLAIVIAMIMTKVMMVKHNNIVIFHAFGYTKKKLFMPFLFVAMLIYGLFTLLHTTEFSYAKDRAELLLANKYDDYRVKDLFFKYNDAFVYIKDLDPVHKKITNITIFKIKGQKVSYTVHAPVATFVGEEWDAEEVVLKRHIYKNGVLLRYEEEYKESMKTLQGYKPKIIESLYEGEGLNIIDAFHAWRLLLKQSLNSEKIRATLYDKVITPLFSIALLLILFFKLPYHARLVNMSVNVAAAIGSIIGVWGILFGLARIGYNGVIPPEFTSLLPILLLSGYAAYLYIVDEKIL